MLLTLSVHLDISKESGGKREGERKCGIPEMHSNVSLVSGHFLSVNCYFWLVFVLYV